MNDAARAAVAEGAVAETRNPFVSAPFQYIRLATVLPTFMGKKSQLIGDDEGSAE